MITGIPKKPTFHIAGIPVFVGGSAWLISLVWAVHGAWSGSPYGLIDGLFLFAIMLIHELGHAVVSRRLNLAVHRIELHAFHGLCVHDAGSPKKLAIVAWGGVLAQTLVGVPVALFALLWPWSVSPLVSVFLEAFGWTNFMIIALNLIPVPPLDGARAWGLLRPGGLPDYERPTEGHKRPTRGYKRPTGDYKRPTPGQNRPAEGYIRPNGEHSLGKRGERGEQQRRDRYGDDDLVE